MVTLPAEGRVFTHRDRVMLGDVSPSGRARLDAFARWLQDAAYDDALDSGIDRRARGSCAGWRCASCASRGCSTRSRSTRSAAAPPRCGRSDRASCAAAATGRARRRAVGAPRAGRLAPAAAPDGFDAVYGPSAAAAACAPACITRGAAAGAPPALALPRRDLDPGHVNNAVYWAALEEELVADEPRRAGGRGRAPRGGRDRRGRRPPRRRDALDHRRGRRRGGDVQAGRLTASRPSGAPQSSSEAGAAIP